MSTLDLLVAFAGVGVTLLVVLAMVLITPGGIEMVPERTADADEPQPSSRTLADLTP